MKDKENKNHYVPNPETAWVVKKIFQMLKEEILPSDVAQWLNDNKIPVPSESVGNVHTRTVNEIKRKWNRTAVVRIAKDKTYLGYVISGKTKKVSYKSKKVISVPKEEQIIKPNMHEPLIDQETFDIVQKLIESRTKTRNRKHDFLLKGLLECEECGKKLSVICSKQKSGNEILYLRCNTYATMTRLNLCTPHTNNCEKLTQQILDMIKERCKQYLDEEKYIKIANKIKDRTLWKKNIIQSQITSLEQKINLMNKKIDTLYQDRLSGIISVDDFERLYTTILDEKNLLQQEVEEMKKQKENTDNQIDLDKIVKRFIKMKDIDRSILVQLVDNITVSEERKITIHYKFNVLNEKQTKDNIIKMKAL